MSNETSPNTTYESEAEEINDSFEESDPEEENEAVAKTEVNSQEENIQLDENLNIRKLLHSPIPATKSTNDQKVTKKKSTHPPTQVMVDMALNSLNDRMGSSVPAIKKFILQNFDDVNEKRLGFFVLKYMKKSIEEGKIKKNKGKYKILPIKNTAKPKTTIDKKTKITTKKVKPKVINDNDEKPSTSKQIQPRATADITKQKSNKTVNKKKSTTTTTKVKESAETQKTTKKITNNDAKNITKDVISVPVKNVTKKDTKKKAAPTLKIATNLNISKIRTTRAKNKTKVADENPSKKDAPKAMEIKKAASKSKTSKKK